MAFNNKKTFEFWLGRAGSGKTSYCVESIAGQLRESPRGRPLLLLVPEQASAQMERAIAMSPGVAGYTRARVVTFRYLQREALVEAGDRAREVIDEDARTMLLRGSLRRRASELRLLGECADLPGMAESVGRALVEFQRHGWTPDDLRARLAGIAKDHDLQPQSHWKLADIATLWEDHRADLAARGLLDDAESARRAADAIRAWGDLDGARLWIDGFASFTAQERALLEALLERTEHVAMTLLLDPARASFRARRDLIHGKLPPEALWAGLEALDRSPAGDRIFGVAETAYARLAARLMELGWAAREIEFPVEGRPTRFDGSAALALMERELTAPLRPRAMSPAEWAEAVELACGDTPVELIETDDRRGEVEFVAERLLALGRGAGAGAPSIPWEEMVVLTRDLDDYAPLVREIFPRYGLPFFLDQTRDVASHPLARLIVSALRIVAEGWSGRNILALLKTGLTPLRVSDAAARLENFSREARLTEADWRAGAGSGAAGSARGGRARGANAPPPQASADVHRIWSGREGAAMLPVWRAAAAPLAALDAALARPGAEPARAIWECLEAMGARAEVEAWIERARAAGDEEQALAHESAWRQTIETLDRLEKIGLSSRDSIDRVELLEAVEAGLMTVRGGLIPPTLRQVLVGAVDRTRTPPARIVFTLGMNEGEFPRVHDEDPLLADLERRALTAGGRELGPDTATRYAQERYLAYVALTRSSGRVVVSRPVSGDGDRPAGRSPFFRALMEMFPIGVARHARADAAPDAANRAEPAASAAAAASSPSSAAPRPRLIEQWAGEVARSLAAARAGGDSQPLARAMGGPHPSRIARDAGSPEAARRVDRVFEALLPDRPAALDPALALRFWRADPRLGATALEDHGWCPFKFFVNRALKLRSRAEPTPGAIEMGILRHHILEYLFARLKTPAGVDWGAVELERARELIDEALAEALGGAGPASADFSRGVVNRALARMVAEEMIWFVRALKAMGSRYGLNQAHAELRFAGGDGSALEVTAPTPNGEPLVFAVEGAADRIDMERGHSGGGPRRVVIYDYKSGKRGVHAGRLSHGLDLQLYFYALALEGVFNRRAKTPDRRVRVAGAFYWPMGVGVAQAEGDPGDWAEPGSDAWFQNHKIQGVFQQSVAPALDARAAYEAPSPVFSIKYNKDGHALHGGTTGWLPDAAFRLALEETRELIEARVARIASGHIAIEPTRAGSGGSACGMCDAAEICRIHWMESPPAHSLPALSFINYRKRLAGLDLPVVGTPKPRAAAGRKS